MVQDLEFMKLALDAASKGWPRVVPNPMVGCVITKNGNVISIGHHEIFGGPHAEVVAVNKMPGNILPSDCTLYVTLEPCTHFGKTPPCVDLLIEKGFKKVVVATTDPNPLVAGKGIEKLRNAGIEVVTGILEKEAIDLNRRFFTFHSQGRPYIILKWAITSDGFVSRDPAPADRSQNLITRNDAQQFVHELRATSQGIMVGKNTVKIDDPALTTRLVEGKNPTRIVLDKNLELSTSLQVFNTDAATVIYNRLKDEEVKNVVFKKLDFEQDILNSVLSDLHLKGIQTLLVEGGPKLLESFLAADVWDEAFVFQNPDLRFEKGLKGPVFPLKNSFELIGQDKLFHHFKQETLPAKGPLSREIF